ncbi:MAG: type II toxin-antitoxin system PemK/MazF family toxin [Bryobacter sp.]|jgi:mRNA interferase MazF|nr:type II toxin-antitoxin system PemK/MazF family toxin [Bryobacter sp.]
MERGEIWWADLPDPVGSGPGYRRPVLVIQADPFNRSRIPTVVVAVVTSNLRLAQAPGNVLLPAKESGLARDSVVNVSQILTLDRELLPRRAGRLPQRLRGAVESGLRQVLGL